MKVKEESEKVGLKLNIQKTKIMASGPITSWQIDGETVLDFIFGGSKITADGDCNHEIKRRLLLGRKVMTNLDSIFKSRDITLPTQVHLIKAMVLVVMYGCESWTVKKAECRRIDAFELWCRRRLLRVSWTTRRSNQSILKEINPDYSLEELMLKLQYSGHLMWRADSLEKTLMLGKIEHRKEEKGTMEDELVGWHHWLNGHDFEQALGDGEGQGSLACCGPWGRKKLDTTERLNNNNNSIVVIELFLWNRVNKEINVSWNISAFAIPHLTKIFLSWNTGKKGCHSKQKSRVQESASAHQILGEKNSTDYLWLNITERDIKLLKDF